MSLPTNLDRDVINAGLDLGIPLGLIEDAYYGYYETDIEFAQDIANITDAIDNTVAWPHNHVDWEKAADALMNDYTECNGYYFSDNY